MNKLSLQTKEGCQKQYEKLEQLLFHSEQKAQILLNAYFVRRGILAKFIYLLLMAAVISFVLFAIYLQTIFFTLTVIFLGGVLVVLVYILFGFDSTLRYNLNFERRKKAFAKLTHLTPVLAKPYTEWLDSVNEYEILNKELMSSQQFIAYAIIHELKNNDSVKEFMFNKIFD